MGFLTDLKDGIVRKIATSFLLRFADGKKTSIMRIVQAINHVIVALFLAAVVSKEEFGYDIAPFIESVNAQWVVVIQFLGGLGLQLGLADADAKKRLGE